VPNETNTPRLGGSFAPPIDDKTLASYRKIADDAPPQVAGGMKVLADMLDLYHGGEVGKATRGTRRPTRRGVVVKLPTVANLPGDEVKRIWDAVPWGEELEMYAAIFDRIDPGSQKELRDAAFHLLWFGWELFHDRVPMTDDQLEIESPESSEQPES
jgi:hypothetical protein